MKLPLFGLVAGCFPAAALARPQHESSPPDNSASHPKLPPAGKYISYAQAQKNDAIKSINYPKDHHKSAIIDLLPILFPKLDFYCEDFYPSSDGVWHFYCSPVSDGLVVQNVFFNANIKDGKIFSYGGDWEQLERLEHESSVQVQVSNSAEENVSVSSTVQISNSTEDTIREHTSGSATVRIFNSTKDTENSPTKRDIPIPIPALKTAITDLKLNVTTDGVRAEAVNGTKHSYVFTGLGGPIVNSQAQLGLFFTGDDGRYLARCWKIDIDIGSDRLVIYVDATDPNKVHHKSSLISHYRATYEVYPWGVRSPADGERKVIGDPWNIKASPFTWLGQGRGGYQSTTRGNNAIVGMVLNHTENDDPNHMYFPSAGSDRKFEYPYSNQSRPEDYRDASITQAFYTVNMYHDLLYTLGFNEQAGNFQANNDGQGGKENDPVVVFVQYWNGTNNAVFSQAPDGESPRILLSLYYNDAGEDPRDPSFDADIIVHEYTHGLSGRLTGGPANTYCLNEDDQLEARGLSEGWSDFMALAVRINSTDNRNTQYALGGWSGANAGGVRSVPYTTDKTVAPVTYGHLTNKDHVYEGGGWNAAQLPYWIGEVWVNTLLEVLWNLVEKHGITDRAIPSFDARGVPTDGRYLTMKLVMHGMMLQPCFPNMIGARDAILDADFALTGGENQCEIWRGFAARGLGFDASYSQNSNRGSDAVPDGVC